MPENPLLPNAKLRALYALMQRARALSKAPAGSPRFEALLAATLLHLEPGDFVSPPPDAPVAAALAAERVLKPSRKRSAPQPELVPLPPGQRLATVAGVAGGLKLAGAERIAAYYADAGQATARREAGWADALTFAHRAELPLLLICADSTGQRSTLSQSAKSGALTWPAMASLAKRLRLPVLTVDGTDAPAVYRVMQESTQRARWGGGTAVLWCSLHAGALDPLKHMRRYLAARNLLPPS